jgi:hypothetical protein
LEEFKDFIGDGEESTPLPLDYQNQLVTDETEIDETFPYRSMVGSLMYAMLGTQPLLAFAISLVSRHLSKPTKLHCKFVQHIFKYLKSHQYSLCYTKSGTTLKGYVDASYANQIDYKSTTGHLIFMGSNLINWYSAKQGCYTHSSAEAEYIALSTYIKELLWQQQLMADLDFKQNNTVTFEDNTSAIAMATNPQENHKRTKHIQVSHHSTRDYVKNKVLELQYIPTAKQLADVTTKIVRGSTMQALAKTMNLIRTIPKSRRQL